MKVQTEFVNMVMIERDGMVVVQERALYWKGIAFPGGHLERGESFVGAAVREVREETGLEVRNLRLCGTVDWENDDTGERYVCFLYRTSDFTGELLPGTGEGRNFWAPLDGLRTMKLCENFGEYLHVFLEDAPSELFGRHGSRIPHSTVLL